MLQVAQVAVYSQINTKHINTVWGRAYSCWMLNWWCITCTVGFKRLTTLIPICSPDFCVEILRKTTENIMIISFLSDLRTRNQLKVSKRSIPTLYSLHADWYRMFNLKVDRQLNREYFTSDAIYNGSAGMTLYYYMCRSWQDCCRRGENRSWPSVSVESVDSECWCLKNAILRFHNAVNSGRTCIYFGKLFKTDVLRPL